MSITLIGAVAGFGAGAAVRLRLDALCDEGVSLAGFVDPEDDDFALDCGVFVLPLDDGTAGAEESFGDFDAFAVLRARRVFDGFDFGGFLEVFFGGLGADFLAAR